MAGPVIENLSNRKLFGIILSMILAEIIFILVGGIKSPQPTHHTGPASMKVCKEGDNATQMINPWNCEETSLKPSSTSNISPDSVVFVGMLPPSSPLSQIKWFQYLLCLAVIHIEFFVDNQVKDDAVITLNLRLAYSDEDKDLLLNDKRSDLWIQYHNSEEHRPLICTFNYNKIKAFEKYEYECDPLFIFQLGSVPHKRYLLNIKLPLKSSHSTEINQGIGQIADIELVGISQTGGFTWRYLIMKSVMTIVLLAPVIWFWRRVLQLSRKPMLIEKACFALGLTMIFLNIPFEYITIPFDAPWMLLFTDIRQGLFYAVLFSFWVVFIGEHMMDQVHRNKLSTYKWHLTCIFLTSFALLSFDLAERGMQLHNPFGTIWSNPGMGYALLALGGISATLYLILLIYLIYKVLRSIRYKRRFVLREERAIRFRVIVRRLQHIMLLTLATASLTVAFFFLEQKMEGVINDFLPSYEFQVSSAFFTGVYGLWNIYVIIILMMYAPSHKIYEVAPVDEDDSEEHEMDALNQVTEQSEIFLVGQIKSNED